jgi:anti-repressor protein
MFTHWLQHSFKMKVIDRMHELEEIVNQQPLKLPTSKELALMVIQAEEEKEKLQLEVDYLKPKAEFHDMAVDIHGAVSVGQAAKTLGTGRNRLLQLMRQRKWINRRNEPYQDKIEQGLLDVKLSNWEHPEKGIQEVITTLVTGKGITKLTKMLSAKLVA